METAYLDCYSNLSFTYLQPSWEYSLRNLSPCVSPCNLHLRTSSGRERKLSVAFWPLTAILIWIIFPARTATQKLFFRVNKIDLDTSTFYSIPVHIERSALVIYPNEEVILAGVARKGPGGAIRIKENEKQYVLNSAQGLLLLLSKSIWPTIALYDTVPVRLCLQLYLDTVGLPRSNNHGWLRGVSVVCRVQVGGEGPQVPRVSVESLKIVKKNIHNVV